MFSIWLPNLPPLCSCKRVNSRVITKKQDIFVTNRWKKIPPPKTYHSKEGISCLLYVNNIKLWTEREPGTDSLIYKDNIKMSYKQQSKHQISGTATLTISCFFIRISRPDCHDILIFLVFRISASNYSGLLYKRGIVPFGIQLLHFCFHGNCIINAKLVDLEAHDCGLVRIAPSYVVVR